MIRWIIRRPVTSAVAAMTGLIGISVGSAAVARWWVSLDPLVQLVAIAGGAITAIAVVDRAINRVLRFSPLVLFLRLAEFLTGMGGDHAKTGREEYDSKAADSVRRLLTRSTDGSVPVDDVHRRDPAGPAAPVLDRAVSMYVAGRTGVGKSSFVKEQIRHWDLDEPVIAHALSEPGDYNELSKFFEDLGSEVIEISSRNSDVRWDPLSDAEQSITQMENVASAVFSSRNIKITGWSEGVRSMLIAAVTITSARHDDFSKLPEVIDEGPEYIRESIEQVPNAELVAASMTDGDDDLQTVYKNLLNRIRPILHSDICDESLPRISLEEYFRDPDGRTIVLDNIEEDEYATGFWRFFCQSAINIARRTEGRQQIVLDELPALPQIENIEGMTSRGRSADVRGIVVAQDAHQMDTIYGDLARSIWANCPNSVMFAPGDAETAEMALSTLGEVDLNKKSVASGETATTTSSIEPGKPLLSGDLMNLDVGEALISSPKGWWLAKITEPDP